MFLDVIRPSTKIIELGDLSTKQVLNNTIFQVVVIAMLIIILSLILALILKKNRVQG